MWRGGYHVFITSYRRLLTTQLEHRQIGAAERCLLYRAFNKICRIWRSIFIKREKQNCDPIYCDPLYLIYLHIHILASTFETSID